MIPVIANGLATAARIFPLAARLLAPYKGSSGLVNLAMDAIPIAIDASNDNLGWHSLSSIAGTHIGYGMGRGRGLNAKGVEKLENFKKGSYYTGGVYDTQEASRATRPIGGLRGGSTPESAAASSRYTSAGFNKANDYVAARERELLNDPRYSDKSFNMPLGIAADMGLSAVSYPMSQKAKEYDALQKRGRMAELNNDVLAQYMRMT